MAEEEGKYNIKAVSNLIGIQAGTLRAWERRYQVIAPKRNDAGHRLYTERHVKILRWLVDKVNQGFTISQAISLLDQNEVDGISSYEEQELQGNRLNEIAEELLQTLLQFNERRARELLQHAFSMFSIDQVVVDILGTVLVKVGDMWELGETTTAHEHFTSSFLRSQIGAIFQTMPVDPVLPKCVAVCGPNEEHEFGLLMFTLFLRHKGYDVIYLGRSVADGDLDVVIDEVEPRFLFISCTLKKNLTKTLRLAQQLSSQYESLSIGLGGYAIETMSQEQKEVHTAFLLGSSKSEWHSWLQAELKK